MPEATIAVCTFKRPASLLRAIAGLAGQDDPGMTWEVLVIDNDAAASAAELEARLRPLLAVPLRTVVEPVAGAAAARNRAVAEAQGRITVFLDDDVTPEPGWLRALLEPLIAGRSDAAGGRVILDPAVGRPWWFDEQAIGGYLTRFEPAEEERALRPGEFVVTANAAFSTRLLRATGGFAPRLGPRAGVPMVNDDVLITRRYMAAGGAIRYVPAATVVHELPPERLRARYLLRRAYAQGRSDWIVDRDVLGRRRAGGARVAAGWWRSQWRRRAGEGLWRPQVAFHAACDAARTAGALREAAVLAAAVLAAKRAAGPGPGGRL